MIYPQSSFRLDIGLLFFAEFLIHFKPHPCAVPDDPRCPLPTPLYVQLYLLRCHIKLRLARRFHRYLILLRNREDVSDRVVIEHGHQLRRKFPHSTVYHHRGHATVNNVWLPVYVYVWEDATILS